MSIIRSPRKENNFYVLDKTISEDKRLGWAARGLLIYLLGKPDNWNVSIEALRKDTADSAHPTGRDGVYKLISELISVGYIRRVFRHVGGKADGYDYLVSEQPALFPENQDTENQFTESTTLISNEVKQGLIENKEAAKAAPRARKQSNEKTLAEWRDEMKDKGEKMIPADDPIWNDGISKVFLHLAWKVFAEDMEQKGKKAKDWRAQFRTYVRKDYLKLWAVNREGQYYLTTAGKTAALRFDMGDLINE